MDNSLTQQQLTVIEALSSGATAADAASQAGVHRNTIANWRRNSLSFQEALSCAQYEKALLHRERTETLADRAYRTLEAILDDPKASSASKLKAAIYIIEKASTPPLAQSFYAPLLPRVVPSAPRPIAPPPPAVPAEIPAQLHKNAQLHKSAQPDPLQPYRREQPKVGRNEDCPCGSGQKFKRCCLGKPLLAAQAQAA